MNRFRALGMVLFLLLGPALAQDSLHAYYLGFVGDYPVQADLEFRQGEKGTTVSGSYYYDLIGAPLYLEGRVDDQAVLTLTERSSEGEAVATFRAQLEWQPGDAYPLLAGTWSGAGQELPFSFAKVAEYATLSFTQGRLDSRGTFPFFTAPAFQPLNQALQPGIVRDVTGFFEDGQTTLLAGELFNFWSWDQSTSIHYLTDAFLSAATGVYSYTGGAHGNSNFTSINLRLAGGKAQRIGLADLFAPGAEFLPGLASFVLADLRRQEAAWVVEGSVTEVTLEDLAAFTLTPEGLTFAFDPYVMGPYAQGPMFVTMPLYEVATVAPPAGPLQTLLDGSP